jgi:hypothetical protein
MKFNTHIQICLYIYRHTRILMYDYMHINKYKLININIYMYTHTDISLSKKFNYLKNNAAKKKLSMKFKNNENSINLKKNLNINNSYIDNMRDVDHENEVSCSY